MLDPGSLLNMISLSVLDAVDLLGDKIIRQSINVSSFRGHSTCTVGFVNLDLKVEPIRATHKFHVIDSQTTYHLLLGRSWIHNHKVVPTTYHQRLEAVWKGKRVHVSASESPFQRGEAHFLEAAYFN